MGLLQWSQSQSVIKTEMFELEKVAVNDALLFRQPDAMLLLTENRFGASQHLRRYWPDFLYTTKLI